MVVPLIPSSPKLDPPTPTLSLLSHSPFHPALPSPTHAPEFPYPAGIPVWEYYNFEQIIVLMFSEHVWVLLHLENIKHSS